MRSKRHEAAWDEGLPIRFDHNIKNIMRFPCLMMLAGFETATHGEIYLANRPINDVPPHKRGIGMVSRTTRCFRI